MTSAAPELTVVLPTYNERDNIVTLIGITRHVLSDVDHEILVVDDRSPDGTAAAARAAGQGDPRVRVIERQPPPGLTVSLQDGVEAARGRHVAWLDCDLSHPPELLPQLLAPVKAGVADMACASRYVEGGSDERDSTTARWASYVITRLARWLIDRRVEDYTTGFVLAPRQVIVDLGLHGDYGEYCIQLIADALRRGYRVKEIPYRSVPRRHGESKTATSLIGFIRRGWKYLWTIARMSVANLHGR